MKLHICGYLTNHLPKPCETGADIIDIDLMVEMNTARRELGDVIVLCGDLDPVTVIQDKSTSFAYDESCDLIDMEHDKRFILSCGCEITVNTPFENLMAMRPAAGI